MIVRAKKILLLLFVFSLALTACTDSELSPKNRFYLAIEQSNQYGATINPGSGYFVYDKNAIATIELELTSGYNFKGWQGPNSSELVAVDCGNNKWKLKIDQDKTIKAELELEKFSVTTTAPEFDEDDVPANLKEIRLTFNNKLGISADYLIIEFFKVSVPEENLIDNRDLEIKENQIVIDLGSDYLNQRYLEFGETYELQIANRVLDEAGRSFTMPDLKFEIEIVPPEAPFIGIDKLPAANEIEIFWQRCKDNLKGLGADYVVEYRIYRSLNNKEFSATPYKIISVSAGDFALTDVEISFRENFEQDLDLSNIYFYKVRAVNEEGKVSEFSNLVSTKQI
mgnify:CR=1 FL=1